jgi:nucleotide-binding universal stress UspA family protein
MTKPIVVGHDPRRADHDPLELGAALARLTGAPLAVASVLEGVPTLPVSGEQQVQYAVAQPQDDRLSDCAPAVEQVDVELRALGIPVECRTLRSTGAAKALHEAAEELDAGLLVVGSSRRSGLGRVLIGASTGERLLHGAPCPVAIAPRGWRQGRRIAVVGVAYVDSDEGREALRSGHALARHIGAELRVFTVFEPSPGRRLETEPAASERELRAAVAALDGVPAGVEALVGDPADVLIELSETLDLLVCGSRGYGPLRSVMLGSVSRKLMQAARCPTMVVPRGVRASLESILASAPELPLRQPG